MSKRGHHEGNIVQLNDGRFRGRMMLGYKPGTFRKNLVNVYGETRQEVKDKMNDMYRVFQAKQGVMPSEWTVGSWLDHYLKNYVRVRTRRVTYENYEMLARLHIKPEIGGIKLSELTTSHVQSLMRLKSQSGSVRFEGKELGPTAIRRIRNICRMALAQAVLEGLVARNPVLATTPIRPIYKEKAVMTSDQVETFLTAARENRLFCLYYLYITTGLRRSEALALRWSDYDEQRKMIKVVRARTQYNEPNEWFSEPKTESSRRTIPLTDKMVQELTAHRVRQETEKTAAGNSYGENDLIFCREDGLPLHPDFITSMTKKQMKKANLPNFTTHSLRHSFASMLGQIGVSPKVAQELLGHATIRMTMDVYSHVFPGMKESAVDQLSVLLKEEKNVEKDAGNVNSGPETNAKSIMQKNKAREANVIYLSTYAKLRRIS